MQDFVHQPFQEFEKDFGGPEFKVKGLGLLLGAGLSLGF